MGLQRPPDPFHRVYSGPEPPSPSRRPRRALLLLVAAVAFAAAAVAVFLLLPTPGGDNGTAVKPTTPATSQEQVAKTLPEPCGTVSQGTVDETVPKATRTQSANSTFTTCTYSSTGRAFRWLRIEARLYSPANTPTPTKDAERYYKARWTQAHHAPLFRTIALEPNRDIGDEAYSWYKADVGPPTVVAEITARIRNVIFTVSYSESARGRGAQDARERACLARATAVAREVRTGLSHF